MKNYLNCAHSSWHDILATSFDSLDKEYQKFLFHDKSFFPTIDKIFSTFILPKEQTKYILFGQDPYPRIQSANGFAFIDANVESLWSQNGLSKEVNKATSLRNMMKMFLLANDYLNQNNLSQESIANLDKSNLIQTVDNLKNSFLSHGFLLLNSALIFTDKTKSKYHAKMWQPFLRKFLSMIEDDGITLLLWGKISKDIDKLNFNCKRIYSEHPYNTSFITNKDNLEFFKRFDLLRINPLT
jgi:uracil-DNA glycosylase